MTKMHMISAKGVEVAIMDFPHYNKIMELLDNENA